MEDNVTPLCLCVKQEITVNIGVPKHSFCPRLRVEPF
jgi:hypothetical protein